MCGSTSIRWHQCVPRLAPVVKVRSQCRDEWAIMNHDQEGTRQWCRMMGKTSECLDLTVNGRAPIVYKKLALEFSTAR